ncbi:hypothetical protein C8Q75DRAFT_752615 [Abortiporus biennis]|nr:hypothetical protein C8Q75DRAFT_752615 [Abortiporus biennis]
MDYNPAKTESLHGTLTDAIQYISGTLDNTLSEYSVQPRRRRVLPPAAANLLKNYYKDISKKPNIGQRKALLKELHCIPGTEWYTMQHLYNYFLQKNKSYSISNNAPSASSCTASLSAQPLQHFSTILTPVAGPSSVLNIPAELQIPSSIPDSSEISTAVFAQTEHESEALGPESFSNDAVGSSSSDMLGRLENMGSNYNFQRDFERHEEMMHEFLMKIKNGEYASLGFDPSFVKNGSD